MNKTVKGIIGLSAALAVLGGGFAALKLTEPKEEESSVPETSENTEPTITLIRDETVEGTDPGTGADLKGVVKSVHVKNQTDEFDVVQKPKEEGKDYVTYTIDGYQDVVMKDSIIGTLAHNANGLKSKQTIEESCTENGIDIAKFGLADPVITVDLTYETGAVFTLLIGNETPMGGTTYVMVEGTDSVYAVQSSTLANYSKTINEFVENKLLDAPDETPIVNSLRIQRQDIDYDLLLEYDDTAQSTYAGGTSASHRMKEPTVADISVERSINVTTGMFGLSAEDIYAVHCGGEEIAEAGLRDPFCTVTMDCDDGNVYRLLLSETFIDETYGKCCYAMMEGGNVIFIVTAEKAIWAELQPVDILSGMYISNYVWSISELDLKCGGEEYSFRISQIDPDAELESPKVTDFRVTLNGAEIETERYRQLYSFILSSDAETFALDETIPGGEPMVDLEFYDWYRDERVKVEFYEYSAMSALVVINGESKFFTSKAYVKTLAENAAIVTTDQELKTTW